ncbi:MAG: tetratricopeptide repeat protein [Anaerolineae bacterium]|nr:tetratricopeptide repeat protein [Anaerolineae bacterium]
MALEDRIRLPALNLIHRRARLLDTLAGFIEAHYRLITVYAPGGYGKSILLADFAQTTDLPVCWCSLEPADRDPTSFLTLLAYSITDRFHEIEPDRLLKVVQQGDTQVSIRHLADLLANVGPHLIIIDDYHKAVSAGMTLALNRLLEQLPSTSTMIVAARGDMALETGQIIDLLIAEQATGLSEEELRFTPAELQRVMRKRFGRQIDLATAAEIAQATDGNIAQILLTGHLMHADELLGRLGQRLGDDREVIYDYLATEVFDKQPPELQRFMLRTAILPEMTAELCNELLEITDAHTYLEQLIRRDLFITQVGVGFRYHDLFAEFLQTKLAEDEQLYGQISVKAGHLLTARSRFEEAAALYLSVQAWDETVTLLENRGGFFYDTGRALTLHNWLAQIPKQELNQRPRLLLLQGRVLANDLSKPEAAQTLFKQAAQQFSRQDDLIGAAEAEVWQSVSLRMMGQAEESLALVSKGLAQLDALDAEKRVIAWATRYRGIAYGVSGKVPESISDLYQALALFERIGDTYNIGICHHDIGISLERQGHVDGAINHFRQAIQIWETLGNGNDLARSLNSLGVSLQMLGHYDEALERFNESIEIALRIGAISRAAYAQASIGDVYLACQKYELSDEAFTKSTELARQVGAKSLEIYNVVKQGECLFQQQQLDQALSLSISAQHHAAENGLNFEKGLACTLQAKIYVRRARYRDSYSLFAEALTSFAQSDILEQARVRLWWGYSLLLDCKAKAAFEQLQKAIGLALTMDQLRVGLGPTVGETQQLLLHFRHHADTSPGVRDSIRALLEEKQSTLQTSRPSLQVFAFGPASLIVAGEYKHFLSMRGSVHKMPEFLLYLILEGRGEGCRWNDISVALWPDIEPEKASDSFHHVLKRLRSSIFGRSDYITVQNDIYRINSDYLEWCDALAFESLFQEASIAPPKEKLALQLELIDLYRGEFLASFELEEWGATYRTKYEIQFLQMINLTSEQLLEARDPRHALTVINKGLARDNFREDLHCNALRAYAQLGLYDDLKDYYREINKFFKEELGEPPAPETQQLYKQLLTAKINFT